jgi:hypothetical protein
MKKLFLLLTLPMFTQGMIIDELDGRFIAHPKGNEILVKQQHILDLCRSSKKDSEHCKKIEHIFDCARTAGTFKGFLKFFKCPILDHGMISVALRCRAEDIGQEMGWDKERIDTESELLLQEYAKVRHKK